MTDLFGLTKVIAKESNCFVKLSFVREWISPWRAYLAEFLGTFVFVLVSCGSVLSYIFYGEIGTVGVSLASGLAYAAAMYATVHVSGGHLNSVVTLASWLAQKTNGSTAIFYIVFQLAASFSAAGLLLYIFGQEALQFSLGGPTLGVDIGISKAFVIEASLAATFVFVYFATMVDRRGPTSFGPLVLGLVVTALMLVALPLSGASINPARAVGPAVISQTFDNLMVATVGPLAGSLMGIVYDFVFLRKAKK